MNINQLKPEQKKAALKRVMDELKAIGIELDINNNEDRLKAEILASNLRIEFNSYGGLA